MIHIDKTDNLYKYLKNLGVEDIEKEYLNLASNGRYKLDDIRQYFRATFQPSQAEDIDEKELEKILDYYVDIKTLRKMSAKELKLALNQFKETKDNEIKKLIINSQLKDLLLQCVNYKTLHKDADIQDIVQVANLGLIQAIDKYNEDSRLDFKDYVVYWTREKIREEFEEKKND